MSNIRSDAPFIVDEKSSINFVPPVLPSDRAVARPPIDYSSFGDFWHSIWRRFLSLWTRQFVLSLLSGQVVSLCITCTNVTTEELTTGNWQLPTTQTFFLYFSIFIIYTPYTIYQYGFEGWFKLIYKDGWKYIVLAVCDVEGNFLVVKAYQYTNLLSCMLLDAWAIPVCMFFLFVYMRTRFHWTQILGVFICVLGLGLLVGADQLTNKDWAAVDRGKGDAFMILGSTLYGFTNATEEFFVRRRPLYEVVGQLGMWGVIISGIQASIIEHHKMNEVTWSGRNIGLLFGYTAAMFILYTVAPLLYRLASSAYFNLSLLSSDFYGLLFGLFLFHFKPYWLYFPSYTVVILGLFVYFWHSTPEEQGTLDIQFPSYVTRRGAAEPEMNEAEKQGPV
jgi:solute carrier family 35 protein F1/2